MTRLDGVTADLPQLATLPGRAAIPFALVAMLGGLLLWVDLQLPLGVAGGVPQVILVLLSLPLRNRNLLRFSVVVGAGMVIAGGLFSPAAPEVIPGWVVLANRGLALANLFAVALLCARENTSRHELRERARDLDRELAIRRRAETRLAHQTSELRRSNQELDTFAYVASHDLKAPLRAIDNLSQWIAEDAGELLQPTSREHLETLRRRVLRMERLLDDLLAYSRVGRVNHDVEDVDVGALARDVIELVGPPAGFTVRCGSLPRLRTRRAPLELVFRNVISNALKHHDRSEGCIEIQARELDDFVEFRIADDGPGIPAEHHDRVFRMFQTLKSRDEVEGSGMGLALIKKVVEQLGGSVRIEVGAERGTAFLIRWPLQERTPSLEEEAA